jgi:hypothetical protein
MPVRARNELSLNLLFVAILSGDEHARESHRFQPHSNRREQTGVIRQRDLAPTKCDSWPNLVIAVSRADQAAV